MCGEVGVSFGEIPVETEDRNFDDIIFVFLEVSEEVIFEGDVVFHKVSWVAHIDIS